MIRPQPTRPRKAGLKGEGWHQLDDDLKEALANYSSAHDRPYVYGDDPDIDRLYGNRWGQMMANAPTYVPVTDDIPVEYLEDIERDNTIYALMEETVRVEREMLSTRNEFPSR